MLEVLGLIFISFCFFHFFYINYIYKMSDINLSNKISNMGINEGAVLYIKRLYESSSDYVSPEQYGAVGNGTTDDTSAFQQALATGKIVKCLNTTYAVKDLNITTNQTLQGNNTRLVPVAGAKYVVGLYGFNPRLIDMRIDDDLGNIMRTTYASSIALANATSITVNDPTGFEEGMLINTRLDNGRQWSSVISGVAGNVVSFREALSFQVSIYNEVSACYGLIKVGNVLEATQYWEVKNILFVNCSSAFYIANISSRGICENITIGDLRYCGICSIDEVNDNTFLNIKIYGGHNVQQNFTGTGAKLTFDLTIGVNLLRDLSVYVNNVLKTEGVDYTFNTANQIQFAVAPANGAVIQTFNFLDASIGFYQNNEYNTTPYGGLVEGLLILDCDYGARLRKGAFGFTDCVFDTLSNGILIDSQGTGVPLTFSNSLIGFYTSRGIECKNSTASPSFSGGVYTKATPTLYLPPGASLGNMLVIGAGSVIYVERDSWVGKDADTQISNSGTIYYTGGNSVQTIDGSSALPSYTFGSAPTKGFYKFDSSTIGVAGNAILNDSNSSLSLGNLSSQNPSVNFFTSNTGSYSTASSRIQAYGGSGSGNSGTIEINCNTLNASTGISANKDEAPTLTFPNQSGLTIAGAPFTLLTRDGEWRNLEIKLDCNITATEGSFEITLPNRSTNFADEHDAFGFGISFGDYTLPGLSAGEIVVSATTGTTKAFVYWFSPTGDCYLRFYVKYKAI
jgi:hypothetical protein